ncbi:sigma-70 family RNA polymerase sigma factor [Kutzneria chonburiensis]|uniref:Sigma-70 family RNA polymerase sigma factor n=1 Tax=Kutzneria chonburiensis TaxID=1483604 RepID=A0ABV6MS24_9PSEU|nr:sigma-70 family RNA polymerase sigma factor [Kutzneria chonburiensis]
MDEKWLADQFESNRDHLRAVAYRMLGSTSDAEDAVQESWLRLSRTDTSEVENLGGWLTTVTARVCLDMLRSRKSRREDPIDEAPDAAVAGPEQEALLADSVGPALLVVLETLAPAERLAFVLHDLFAVPFDEIAPIVGRTPTATRQLASRARRRVQGADRPDSDLNRQRRVVDAFLAASRDGNFDALLELLDPDVELRADETTVAASMANHDKGAPLLSARMAGARTVATAFSGKARGALPALIDGNVGAVWMYKGEVMGLFVFTVEDDKVVGLELVNDRERVATAEVEVLPSR